MSEEVCSVVWPRSRHVTGAVAGERRVDELAGKRIAFIWDDLFRGDEMFAAFAEAAQARGAGFTAVTHEQFGNIHGHDERAVVERLGDLLAEHKIDAAVVGVGACGSCTPAVMRACRAVEAAGVPALALISSGFIRQARSVARSLGISHTWIAEYPGVIPNDTDEVFSGKVAEHIVPSLFDGFAALAQGVTVEGDTGAAEFGPRDTVFTGTYDEIQDFFEERMWSDGLPIVPPTVERVEAFLAHTDRDPREVLGVLLPDSREATIWSIAVNGVLAGCRPEYMPLLIGIVEAMADKRWRLEDAGCTPGWEPLVVVSGPVVDELNFNCLGGQMRLGRRANASVGRFARLYMRNIPGFLAPPGDTDKAAIGMSMNVAMAENDEATLAIGWQPTRVERGFALTDSVVTPQSCLAISGPVYTGGPAERQLEVIADAMTRTLGPWAYTTMLYQEAYPLILMSPSVARVLAEAGYSKDDVKKYLFDHVQLPARVLEDCSEVAGGNRLLLSDLVRKGVTPSLYAESDDPDRMVPLLLRPDMVTIVVGGDPGRNQNRIYANNHAQGVPISRLISKRTKEDGPAGYTPEPFAVAGVS
ncbi:MAG TPA: hypothetical protein VHC18_12450 [Amycolatopsis sp.]|nr:hypothetical protein [Amycolatopsis sp.]